MVNEQQVALGVAFISVALMVGGHWLLQKETYQQYSEQWPGHIAQFFYYVGIPYLAVILGLITPRYLGLKGVDHFALINWQSNSWLIQLQQAITLLFLECLLDIPVMLFTGAIALLIFSSVWLFLNHYHVHIFVAHISMVDILYYLLHWAFYRAIFWSVTDNLYLGVVLGSGLIAFELICTQWVQHQKPFRQQQFLITIMLLVLTATVFFYTPNLWLLFSLGWLMTVIVNLNQPTLQSGAVVAG